MHTARTRTRIGARGYSLKLQSALTRLEIVQVETEVETEIEEVAIIPATYSCTYAKSDIKAARSILENLLSSIPSCNEISSIIEVPTEIEEI